MQQGERQWTHTYARSRRVEMMTTGVCQPLTAWPPTLARKRPVTAADTSEMMLQLLATHSTLVNSAPASPRVAQARTMP